MNILAFDTCLDACSVCVARSDEDGSFAVLASAFEPMVMGHAERLMPMVAEAVAGAGLGFEVVDRIAVAVGPGTFTGTRIAIAAARGLALATGAGVVGATSLAVMAEVAVGQLASRFEQGDLAVAVDARRGEVYVQLFGAGGLDVRSQPQVLSIEDAARVGGGGPIVLVGSGAASVAAAAAEIGRQAVADLPGLLPDAVALARMAPGLPLAQAPLAPLYLRAPDAKPQDGKTIARAEP